MKDYQVKIKKENKVVKEVINKLPSLPFTFISCGDYYMIVKEYNSEKLYALKLSDGVLFDNEYTEEKILEHLNNTWKLVQSEVVINEVI